MSGMRNVNSTHHMGRQIM